MQNIILKNSIRGCSQQPKTTPAPETPKIDTSASKSITKDLEVFTKDISKNGTWIIVITGKMTINKDLVLEGTYKNEDVPQTTERLLALYNQNAKHVIMAGYTLTASKSTITSPNTTIEHGIFKGDIYVETNTFQLND